MSLAQGHGGHLIPHEGVDRAHEASSQPLGQLSLHLGLQAFLTVIARPSDLLRDEGGSAESWTGIWGRACSQCQPRPLLAGPPWHADIRYIFADPILVTMFAL